MSLLRRITPLLTVLLATLGLIAVIGHLTRFSPPFPERFPPGPEWYTQQLAQYDRHPASSGAHVVFAGVFIILGLLQFHPRIRARSLTAHRWVGRIFVGLALVIGVTGIWLSIRMPFGGSLETGFGLTVGPYFLYQAYAGWRSARRRDFRAHQRAMMRCFAAGLGVVTMRILDSLFYPLHWIPDRDLFAITLFIGLGINLFLCETWIRLKRLA